MDRTSNYSKSRCRVACIASDGFSNPCFGAWRTHHSGFGIPSWTLVGSRDFDLPGAAAKVFRLLWALCFNA